jgi:hypothetical protein
MPIAISCPECGKGYNLAANQRGKTVVCRGCDTPFEVEDDRPRRSRRDEDVDERPARRRRDEEDDDRPRRSRRDEDEDDRPRRSRRDEEEDERPRRRRDEDEEERPRRSRRDDDEDDRRDPERRPRRDRDEEEEEEERPRAKKSRSSGGGGMMWLLIGGGGGVLVLLIVVGVVLFATGVLGPNRVTKENYEKLKHGMAQKDVEAILGSGKDVTKEHLDEVDKFFGGKMATKDLRNANYKMLQWQSGKNKILVTLVNDKVAGYAGEFEWKGGMIRLRN